MTAGRGNRELEIRVCFLCTRPGEVLRLSGGVQLPTRAVDVQDHLGVRELLCEHPGRRHGGLFIARECEDDATPRLIPFALELDERGDRQRVVQLHVAGPSAVQQSILDYRREGIALPVRWFGLHYVHVSRDHERLEVWILAFPASDQKSGVIDRR